MKVGVYAGSFCPVTKGHVDAIERASKLVDNLIVVIPININKTFKISLEDRTEILKEAVKHVKNVTVCNTHRALADFCKDVKAEIIIKSIRNAVDMQYEMDMADINKSLSGIETVFLAADKKYAVVSSTFVRELAAFGKDITPYVPAHLAEKITKYFKN